MSRCWNRSCMRHHVWKGSSYPDMFLLRHSPLKDRAWSVQNQICVLICCKSSSKTPAARLRRTERGQDLCGFRGDHLKEPNACKDKFTISSRHVIAVKFRREDRGRSIGQFVENKMTERFQGDFAMAAKTPAQSQVLFHAHWPVTGGCTGVKLSSKPNALLWAFRNNLVEASL